MAFRYLLIISGLVLFGSTGALVAYDVYLSAQLRRLLSCSSVKRTAVIGAARPTAHPRRLVLAMRSAERGLRR
jgi:hypothetical protein